MNEDTLDRIDDKPSDEDVEGHELDTGDNSFVDEDVEGHLLDSGGDSLIAPQKNLDDPGL